MYKRYTVAQLKELCEHRCLDYESLRYKRELIDVLERYDEMNSHEIDNDERVCEHGTGDDCKVESEGRQGESVASEGEHAGDNVSVAAGNLPDSGKDGEPNAVSYTHLTLPTIYSV